MTVSVTPAIAPFIGGWIEHLFSWQIIFASLLAYMLIIILLIIFFLPETLVKKDEKNQSISSLRAGLKDLVSHEYYLLCVGIVIFSIFLPNSLSSHQPVYF